MLKAKTTRASLRRERGGTKIPASLYEDKIIPKTAIDPGQEENQSLLNTWERMSPSLKEKRSGKRGNPAWAHLGSLTLGFRGFFIN